MKGKLLIFMILIFMVAVGAVSASDSQAAGEIQDVISAPADEDILADAQNARFSIENSTSPWEISVLDDDDNYVVEGTVTCGFDNPDSKSIFWLTEYSPTFLIQPYWYYNYLPGNLTFSYSGENYNVSDLNVYMDELPDSIIAHDVVDEFTFQATFLDDKGNPLTEGTAMFHIVRDDYYKALDPEIDSNGVASIDVALPVGNYSVQIYNPLTGQKKHCTWNVSKEDESKYVTVKASQVGGRLIASAVDVNGNNVTTGIFLFYDATSMKSEMLYKNDYVNFSLYEFDFGGFPQNISIFYEDYSQYYPNNTTIYVENLNDTILANDTVGKFFEAIFVDDFGNPLNDTEVTFYVAGDDDYWYDFHVKTDANGLAVINPLFADGNYTVLSDNPFTYQRKQNSLIIKKENLTLEATADSIALGENATVVVNGFKHATGNSSLRVGDGIYIADIINGTATFTIPGLIETSDAQIVYRGDDNYNRAETNVLIKVLIATNITLSFTLNDTNVVLIAEVTPGNASGEVIFTVNGENYTAFLNDSKAVYTLSDLTAGDYLVNATYTGDETYLSSISDNVNFTVEKESYNISAPDLVKYYSGPERFTVNLTDSKGNPLTNATVQILINGNSYNRTTDENGIASMAINLNSGVYNATVKYDCCEVTSTITVKATVSGENITKMFKNATQYFATFVDSQGNPLEDGTDVEFNINGVFYTRFIISNGTARMNINLNPGEYVITAKNTNTTELYSNVITVLSTITENNDLTKYYKNDSQYTLRLLDGEGNPVKAGVEVKLNINGVFYTRLTNESGYAKLNINLAPGDYIITAEYNGLMASNNIKVLPTIVTEDLFMKYKDGSQFNATILNGQGQPLTNQKVTFNINGVFYDRISDENGVAHLNINLMDGKYIITTSCNGLDVSNKIMISSAKEDYFATLQRKINAAGEGETIVLDNDVVRGVFYYDSVPVSEDEILINKPVVIDGQGHTVDACAVGRILNITSDNVTLKNISFINGYVVYDNGGAVYNTGDNILISDCQFTENHVYYYGTTIAEGRGGAICSYGNITIINSVFEDNWVTGVDYAGGKGGAIYANATLTVRSSDFKNNVADEGSAIWAYAFKADISDDCTYENNENTLLKFSPEMELNINQTLLKPNESVEITVEFNNHITGNVTLSINDDERIIEIIDDSACLTLSNLTGGVYDVTAEYLENEYFEYASATAIFKVLYDEYGNFTELQKLIDNTASGDTLYLTKNYIRDSEFYESTIYVNKSIRIIGNGFAIDGDGDNIFYIESDNVTLENITFTDCYNSYDAGGAVAIHGDNAIISACQFMGNGLLYGYILKGGALYINGTNAVISDSYFKDNYLSSYMAMEGGAVCCDGDLTVVNSVFKDNFISATEYMGSSGGALYCNGNLTLVNSSFISNWVSAYDAQGGAVYATGTVNITDCEFKGNELYGVYVDGGAVRAAKAFITNSVFGDNCILGSKSWDNPITSTSGGAVSSEEVNICNSNFTSNSASSLDEMQPSRGGAVYSSGICIIDGANFINNTADKGESVWAYQAFSNITNSSFINNKIALVKAYIQAPPMSKMYHGPEKFLVYLTEDGKARANADVNININGADYVRTTNEEGVASMAINLNSGEYNVTVTYEDAVADSTITVMSTIDGEDLTKRFGDETPYQAVFYNSDGYRLEENTEVEFNINGVFYKRLTDDSGEARLNINLNPGEYTITATNPVSGEMHTNTVKVMP